MDSSSKVILVADDEENLRILYAEELGDEGYRVILAQNGKEAIEAINRISFDLIILDIVMPMMDGMEALGRIIRQHSNIPVILYTSYPQYRDDFISWAADAYLIKSPDLTELKAMIGHLLTNEKGGCSRSNSLLAEVPRLIP